uniref:Major capsid protein n=1 Tax=Bacteriophage sp. TaxID=38018 RepID=A0A7G8LRH0_9VIRU|nr:MAG: major capsid protein [Bacteriophage sp.]
MSHFRMDEAGLFLQRQLQYIRPQIFQVAYADIKYPTLLPVTTEAGQGAQTFTYRIMDSTGEFKLIADAAHHLPRAHISQVEKSINIRSFGGSFGYTVQELRAAQMANIALQQRRADAVRRAYQEKVESVAMFGQSTVGLAGFFNNSTVDVIAAHYWFTGTTACGTTSQEMLELLNYGVCAIINASNMKEQPDTILMAYQDYNKVSTTRNSDSSDVTVLEYFLRTNPYIRIVQPINQLDMDNSVLNTNRMVVYKRDPQKVQLHIPQPLELFPPQQRGLQFIVPAHARVGGVALYYPKSVIYVQAS